MKDRYSKNKQSVYLPNVERDEIRAEAKRMDRSISWVFLRAWRIARAQIKDLPSND